MNYQVFSYMPSLSVGTADSPCPRSIRVTPSALSPLLYAILYSIEFQSPVGPRPATLRHRSSSRASRCDSGGGTNNRGSGGTTAGAATPSPAALLTSAVSMVSSFWGRTSTNTAAASTNTPLRSSTSQQQSQLQPPQQRSASAFGGTSGSAFAGAATNPSSSFASPTRALTLAEEAELAALQRQHEQPFVIPVTQVIHKLGGVHITVRETHNPTINHAYGCVMAEVEAIVAEHERKLARLSLRSASFPSQPVGTAALTGGVASPSPSATALNNNSSSGNTTVHNGASAKEGATADLYPLTASTSLAHTATAAGGGEMFAAQSLVPPVGLSRLAASPSPSMTRMGSPASGVSTAAWANVGNNGVDNFNNVYGGCVDDFNPSQDEVGLMLSVRLLSKEVTRWRFTQERPLVEWRFPIIRTSNERMVIRSRAQNPGFTATSSVSSAAAAGFASQGLKEVGGETGSNGTHDLILVNDAAQIHQVLEFILKSSYQTTSMETFTDFTSGELIFDAHVQERRRFV